MKFIFIIQGEGRGHRMQAVALREILEKHGHEVTGTFMGVRFSSVWSGVKDPVPGKSFFFCSPYFISDKKRQGINLLITLLVNAFLLPLYLIEIIRTGLMIRRMKPDMVMNFYDVIGGLALFLAGRKIRKYVVSHHFFFEHPDFSWPEERKAERILLLTHSWICSLSASRKLAISFTRGEDIPGKRIFVIPPLLRKRILESKPADRGYILIYTLYPGYYADVKAWCHDHPGLRVKMFSDFRVLPVDGLPGLECYRIDQDEFINSLAGCSRLICTSGFETLAEAIYLGKSVEVFPTRNHFEQYCNAIDLERSGLGWKKQHFLPVSDIGKEPHLTRQAFRKWALEAEKMILLHLDLN